MFLLLSGLVFTSEVVDESLDFVVYKFNVLLYLVDFELIAAVPNGVIDGLFILSAGEGRAVEEVVPVEKLVIFLKVFFKLDCFFLADPQLLARHFDQFRGRNLFSRQEIPHKSDLVDYHLNIVEAD